MAKGKRAKDKPKNICELDRDSLVTDNVRLVYHIVNKMNVPKHLYDDAICEGYLALLRASRGFDIDRDIEFTTYAYVSIVRQIWKFLKNECKEAAVLRSAANGMHRRTDEDFTNYKILELSIRDFPEPLNKIMYKRIFERKTICEIAQEMNITIPSVLKAIKRAKQIIFGGDEHDKSKGASTER